MKWLLVLAALLLALAGPQAWGRVALWAGLPGVAGHLLSDPAERGVALYRTGDYAGADAEFAAAGRTQTYNRGLSLAGMGQYPLSRAYFDAVLFANPTDAQARANRDAVNALIPPDTGDSIVPGRIAGAGGLGPAGPTPMTTSGVLMINWKRDVEARGIAASDDWLATLSDDPGEFLKLRLKAEYDRRAALGLIRPAEGEPW
ncbi:hypothetical protein [Paracoccus laeviglucosivorans]|uniref:Ca-activated chloride channel family protein n=1 Tax=Paracoccus laeviglucosivorans TaxID=1197861 RepID=A0A521B947_9RHOB|nr:hypothetical protein [Paracoccus laeviglucosivorans]SMO43230.1 Ca-activated chloride channel family protein [Paracoccus laeviglucosivorans]